MKIKTKKYKIISKFLLVIFLANFLFYPHLALSQIGADAINQEIKEKQSRIQELQQKIDEYNQNLGYHRQQSLSLNNQISILNNEIAKLETEIELKNNQIDETNLEIQDTEDKIVNTETNIDTQKTHLSKFIQQMNRLDKQSEIELILTLDSFSEYYNHLHTLGVLQTNTSDALKELKEFKNNLETYIANLEDKKKSLENLKSELEDKKSSLDSRSYAKQSLLSESRDSESKFQSLVNQLKAEQASINAEIIALEKQIRSKLSGNARWEALSSSGFMWPVPNSGITAYFHDPDYPFRYIFEHPAIDIRSSQGSPIKAAASGYVGKVVLNGTNYGYIMLIHADGFSTVYGHISKSFVNEDEYVSQGEAIALSGGMPGTSGAGRLSTGPHLHFEIRKNGIPVNPLDYLP